MANNNVFFFLRCRGRAEFLRVVCPRPPPRRHPQLLQVPREDRRGPAKGGEVRARRNCGSAGAWRGAGGRAGAGRRRRRRRRRIGRRGRRRFSSSSSVRRLAHGQRPQPREQRHQRPAAQGRDPRGGVRVLAGPRGSGRRRAREAGGRRRR